MEGRHLENMGAHFSLLNNTKQLDILIKGHCLPSREDHALAQETLSLSLQQSDSDLDFWRCSSSFTITPTFYTSVSQVGGIVHQKRS